MHALDYEIYFLYIFLFFNFSNEIKYIVINQARLACTFHCTARLPTYCFVTSARHSLPSVPTKLIMCFF